MDLVPPLITDRIVVQLEQTKMRISCVRGGPQRANPKVFKVVPELSDPTGGRVLRQIDVEVLKCIASALPGIDPEHPTGGPCNARFSCRASEDRASVKAQH